MPAAADDLVLAGEFPPADRDHWLAAVAAALDRTGELTPDAALERLRTTTYDGITIEPLYTADDPGTAADAVRRAGARTRRRLGRPPARRRRGRAGPRRRRAGERRDVGPARPHRRRDDRRRPARRRPRRRPARPRPDRAAGRAALAGGRRRPRRVVGAHRRARPAPARSAPIRIGDAAVNGTGASARRAARRRRRVDASGSAPTVPDLRVVTVDGTRFHDAGASDGQELGCTIAAGVEYLRALDARGIDPADAIGRIELRLAATADQFATIAKFRAVRRLWARVAEVVGAPQAAAASPIHAVTSTAMMTAYDPWVNALRSTVACFAAGIAGADAVTVLPHDHLRGAEATELGRRIGRNTQSILLRESHLAEVIDPAGGSWYVERFTDQLAEAAWAWFQEIEQAGGFRQAVAGGLVAERIAATRAARDRRRRHPAGPAHRAHRVPRHRRATPTARRQLAAARNGDGLAPRRWAERLRGAAPSRRPPRRRRRAAARRVPRHDRHAGAVHAAGRRSPRTSSRSPAWPRSPDRSPTIPTRSPPRSSSRAATVACLCSSDAVYAEHAAPVAAGAPRRRRRSPCTSPGRPPGRASSGRSTSASTCAPPSPSSSTSWTVPAMIPDFSTVPLRVATRHRRRRGTPCRRRPRLWETPEGIDVARPVHGRRRRGHRLPRHVPGHRARSCAARTRRCTSTSRGRSASTPGSRRPRSPTPSTAATWPPARRACRWRSTWRPTAATTATTRVSPATSAWPAWPSTRSSTCASCSTTSRSTR